MQDRADIVTHEQLEDELKQLPGLIRKKFLTWSHGARPFQLEAISAQVLGVDVLLHAATGAGKTGIAAGPHLLPCCKGKVTIMISPLLALQDEQVTTFDKEFGLDAVAVNSSNGFPTKALLTDIVAGKYHIVILSPEMLLSRRFIENVLRKPGFTSRVLSIFIDEAHCISHWGDSFRKKYASIAIVRAFLPKTIPVIAVSATLVPRVRKDIVSKLQFDSHSYQFINIGNDRPNVAQIVRAAEYPFNSYRNLEFMVPVVVQNPSDVPKGFIYCDEIKAGNSITDHLNARVPLQYHNWGMVRPYNAAMSAEYRMQVLVLFKAGIVHILVCTDAAGMGCNIPDVEIVVQWKLPATLSSWVQRMGRAARAIECGTAVLIVEKSAFDVDCSTVNAQKLDRQGVQTAVGKGYRTQRSVVRKPQGTTQGSRQSGSLALRGSHGGANDSITQDSEIVSVSESATAEGLYEYIQTLACRRRLLCQSTQCKTPETPRRIESTPPHTPWASWVRPGYIHT